MTDRMGRTRFAPAVPWLWTLARLPHYSPRSDHENAIASLLVLLGIGLAAQPPRGACWGRTRQSWSSTLDRPGAKVSPLLWGIFFEDINCSADGGLYAELVRNRSFEDSRQAGPLDAGDQRAGQRPSWPSTRDSRPARRTRSR